MRLSRLSALFMLAGAVLVASCASDDPTAPGAGSLTRFVIVSGGNQVGTAGADLPQPLKVQALDANQQPVPDVVVNFVVTGGGGSVFAGSALTDASGIAAEIWRLGQVAGVAQTLEVRAVDANGTPHVYGTFSATAVAGAPVSIEKIAGDAQAGPVNSALPIAPAVKLVDQYGNPVPNHSVTFAVASGGGQITGGTAVSDAGGIATVGSWTLGVTAGLNTLTATAVGLPSTPVTFTATAGGGVGSLSFGTLPSTSAQSGIALAQQPSVQLLDGQGAPMATAGVQVSAILVGSGATLGGTTTISTDGTGLAVFTDLVISGQAGSGYTLQFEVSGVTPLGSGAISLGAGTPVSLTISAGDGQSVNAGTAVAVAPAVVVTDAWGNPVPGISITFTIGLGGGAATGATQMTSASGTATVGGWTLGPLSGANSLVASVTAGPLQVTFNATALGNFWSGRAPMLTARRYAAYGVINGLFYVAGGRNGNSNTLNTMEVYNPATNTWTARASMSTVRAGAVAGVINGLLYVVGGVNGSNTTLSSMEAYDPATNKWTTKASLPVARTYAAAGVINNILYVAGGGGGGANAELYAYNPATNSWTQKASLPMGRVDVTGATLNGLFYVVGGTTTTTVDGGLYAYDPQTDSWSQKATMSVKRYHLSAEVIGNRIYAVGGYAIGGSVSPVMEAYDPATDSWTTLAPLSSGRVTVALGAINGLLYSAGGVTSAATITTTDAYVP